MRQTTKMMAAHKLAASLNFAYADEDLYSALAKADYGWDSVAKRWYKIEKKGLSTGQVDIRLRSGLGEDSNGRMEVEAVAAVLTEVLEERGFLIIRESDVNPDDRRGPAVTGRIYITAKLP